MDFANINSLERRNVSELGPVSTLIVSTLY